jgi:hypothetical protein
VRGCSGDPLAKATSQTAPGGSEDDPSPGGGARVTLIWLDDSGLGRKRRRVFFVLHGRSSRGIYIGAASRREAKGLLAESISNSKLESHFGWDSDSELVLIGENFPLTGRWWTGATQC